MKKTLALTLVLIVCLSLCSCNSSKGMEIGEPVKKGITQVTLVKVEMADTNYVKAETQNDDFLTPINKDDLQLNEKFIKSLNTDDAAIVVTAIVKNVGKNDLNFSAGFFEINYDNGNIYRAKEVYAKDANGLWKEYDKVLLEKVTSSETEVRFVVWVPNTIVNSSASLELDFYGYTYKIR